MILLKILKPQMGSRQDSVSFDDIDESRLLMQKFQYFYLQHCYACRLQESDAPDQMQKARSCCCFKASKSNPLCLYIDRNFMDYISALNEAHTHMLELIQDGKN